MKTPPRTKTPAGPRPPSRPTAIGKHSLLISGHETSISLEDAFWQALKRIAAARCLPVAALVAAIDAGRGDANLSSAIRVYVLAEALSPDRAQNQRTEIDSEDQ